MCKSMIKLSNRVLFVLVFTVVLFGCKQKHIDISSSSEYNQYIERSYSAKKDMLIIGINSPPGYEEKIDFYIITKRYYVEHIAPEDVTRDIFKQGSSFKIISIKECSNCLWFVQPKHAVVVTQDFETKLAVPITVSMHEITPGGSLVHPT